MAKFNLDPITQSSIIIKLFNNVQNIKDLSEQLISGSLQGCLVNPKYIVDPLQLVVAANKALVAKNTTTKSIFTEILFNLSISKNITNSLKQFGVSDDCTAILVIVVNNDCDGIFEKIHGDEVELKDLLEFADIEAVNKVYKIGPEESKSCRVLDSVVSRIATKDFISH